MTGDLVELQRTLYASRNPTRRWLHNSRRDRVTRAIEDAPVRAARRALEIGPGSGIYLPVLCRRFDQVTALDVEPDHIAALREAAETLPNLKLTVGNLAEARWPEAFDLVLCSEVIEHVADPRTFAACLSGALSPGGILILSTPQPCSLVEIAARLALSRPVIGLTRFIYREPVLPMGHVSVMARGELLSLLRRSGLEILYSAYFGLWIPGLAEFGGGFAVALLRRLEAMIQTLGPTGILWTQLHVARKT